MYAESSNVSGVNRVPNCAHVPMNGGSDPMIAPTNVLCTEYLLSGVYTSQYPIHMELATNIVPGFASCM